MVGNVDHMLERVRMGSVVGKVARESSFEIADELTGRRALARRRARSVEVVRNAVLPPVASFDPSLV